MSQEALEFIFALPEVRCHQLGDNNNADGNHDVYGELRAFHLSNNTTADARTCILYVGEKQFSLSIVSTTKITHDKENSFIIRPQDSNTQYQLDLLSASKEEVDIFEDLLANYGVLSRQGSYQNTLAMVDDAGQVVGVLSDKVKLVEEDQVSISDDKTPVIVEVDEAASKEQNQDVRRVKLSTDGDFLVSGSEYISTNLIKSAEYLSQGIKYGSEMLQGSLSPNESPLIFEAVTVNRIRTIKSYSGTALKATRYIVTQIANIAVGVGAKVGNMIVPAESEESSAAARTIRNLAKNSIIAIGNIFQGVEQGVLLVLNDARVATSDVITHKYGNEAGSLASETLDILGNVSLVYFDANGISRRAFVRRALKGAAKNIAGSGNDQKTTRTATENSTSSLAGPSTTPMKKID